MKLHLDVAGIVCLLAASLIFPARSAAQGQQGGLPELAAKVTILQTQVLNLQTLASTLQSDVASKTAQLAALQTVANALQSDAAVKTTQLAALQGNVTILQSNAVTQATQISNIQTKLPAGSTLSNLETVTKVVSADARTLGYHNFVECPAGKWVVGGGATFESLASGVKVVSSGPNFEYGPTRPANGWIVGADTSIVTVPLNLTMTVMCVRIDPDPLLQP